jgi:excisionase family DNA binding protein
VVDMMTFVGYPEGNREGSMSNASDKLLTSLAAGLLIGVSAGTIVRWVREGKIKAGFTPGGQVRVPYREAVRIRQQMDPDWRPDEAVATGSR